MNRGTKSHVTAKNLSLVSNDRVIWLRSVVFRVIYDFSVPCLLVMSYVTQAKRTHSVSVVQWIAVLGQVKNLLTSVFPGKISRLDQR